MNTSLPDIREIEVPSEGAALQHALGDLESKLSAFTTAMRDIEARLDQIAQPQDAAAETGSRRRSRGRAAKVGQVQETVVQEVPPSAQEARPEAQEAQQVVPEAQTVAVQEPQQRPDAQPVEPPGNKKAPPTDARPAGAPQAQAELPATGPAEAPPPEAPPAASEDEVLLASLDEATCKAIKVMRRLDPHKPVKELLKRIEERKDAPRQAAKPASKSWFKKR